MHICSYEIMYSKAVTSSVAYRILRKLDKFDESGSNRQIKTTHVKQ